MHAEPSAEAGRGRRSGAVLMIVLVVLVLSVILGGTMLAFSRADAGETGRAIGTAQAFWTAEAGVEYVKSIAQKRRRPLAYIAYTASPTGYLWGSNVVAGTLQAFNVSVSSNSADVRLVLLNNGEILSNQVTLTRRN